MGKKYEGVRKKLGKNYLFHVAFWLIPNFLFVSVLKDKEKEFECKVNIAFDQTFF